MAAATGIGPIVPIGWRGGGLGDRSHRNWLNIASFVPLWRTSLLIGGHPSRSPVGYVVHTLRTRRCM